MTEPMMLVVVEGGIARTFVVRGEIETVIVDWDVVDEGEQEEVEEQMAEVNRLPDGWHDKSDMIEQIEEALGKFNA